MVGLGIAVGWTVALQDCGGYEIRHLATGPGGAQAGPARERHHASACWPSPATRPRPPIARGYVIGVIPLGVVLIVHRARRGAALRQSRRNRGEWVVPHPRRRDVRFGAPLVRDHRAREECRAAHRRRLRRGRAGRHARSRPASRCSAACSTRPTHAAERRRRRRRGHRQRARTARRARARLAARGHRPRAGHGAGPDRDRRQPRCTSARSRACRWCGWSSRSSAGCRGWSSAPSTCSAALVLLLLASPVLLGTALAIKATSRGPVFFRQERLGINGTEFTHPEVPLDVRRRREAPRRAARAQRAGRRRRAVQDPPRSADHAGRPVDPPAVDRRAAAAGARRRPGPCRSSALGRWPARTRTYTGSARRRLLVRPGLTGLWQVSGRSETELGRRGAAGSVLRRELEPRARPQHPAAHGFRRAGAKGGATDRAPITRYPGIAGSRSTATSTNRRTEFFSNRFPPIVIIG